jgi:hypothetical protein
MARNDAYNLGEGWLTLTPQQRAIYERHALEFLKAMRPINEVTS